jgi:hypothetical protein
LWGAKFLKSDERYLRNDLTPREVALRIRKRPGNSDRPEFGIIDPVDYLSRYIKSFTTWKVPCRETRITQNPKDRSTILLARDPDARLRDGSRPVLLRLIPTLRRGRVHGDLHGRNVHVGIAHGQAHWPSVFDYEDMSVDGLIGLDFVKLETELKIRILPKVLDRPGSEDDSLNLQAFEHSLNNWSYSAQSLAIWPRLEDLAGASPPRPASNRATRQRIDVVKRLARLRTLLLEIRRLASITLGQSAGRPGDWLREYLFLQICYGLGTVRFGNLDERELTSAFIAAGSAAGWLARI